ncbi:enoyl-CoA hydratase-related protein [Nisaea sediminum]|uniref:enoyl-CoA hydratase-related protein n=1 Tax=Nisaea sediminum TaxID=2775867 RepID=UPI001868287F|nr:enoyl-CoA hydratase-related protein [Nisaea sediminum]
MSEPVVLLSKDERGVATVTINRPEVNNAYNGDVIQGLLDVFAALSSDDKVRVVVLRGNGRHFQAGADLRWLNEMGKLSPEENVAVSRRTASAVCGLNDFPKPTVALVHGGCFGGGVGIVAACDVVIASEDAIFAITEARWGVMAGIIVPHLNAAMGPRNVRRYALTCERFGAAKAAEMGLVHEVCPTGGLDAAAAPVIDQLLLSAPIAMTETKQVILDHARITLSDEYFEELVAQHAAKRQSDEAAEGLKSFAEKRNPAWYTGAA